MGRRLGSCTCVVASRQLPVVASQIFAVPSQETVTTLLPSGEKATSATTSECPSKVWRHAPVSTSQIFALLSSEAVVRIYDEIGVVENLIVIEYQVMDKKTSVVNCSYLCQNSSMSVFDVGSTEAIKRLWHIQTGFLRRAIIWWNSSYCQSADILVYDGPPWVMGQRHMISPFELIASCNSHGVPFRNSYIIRCSCCS